MPIVDDRKVDRVLDVDKVWYSDLGKHVTFCYVKYENTSYENSNWEWYGNIKNPEKVDAFEKYRYPPDSHKVHVVCCHKTDLKFTVIVFSLFLYVILYMYIYY